MNLSTLEKVLAAPNLPTLPAVAMKVLELTNKPDVSMKQVAQVIEHDQAIATKVLRTINSSFYGLPKRCGSIQQALTLLGLQTVKGLVLGFSLAKSVDGGDEGEISFDFLSYWRRCMYTAAAAKHLAAQTRRCDPDEAFVAALVQDIGMVALWRALGDRYLQIVDMAGKDHRKLGAAEMKALELDHSVVAGEMTRRWRFPQPIMDAVRCHHRSVDAPIESASIARTVELAGMSASAILGEGVSQEAVSRFCQSSREWFDIETSLALPMLQQISDLAQQLARVFGLNVGDKPDVDGILAQAEKTRTDQTLPAMNIDEILAAEARDAIDQLTGLPDRTVFLRDIDAAFAGKPQSGTGIGLMIVVLDDAKTLNEHHGANAGDSAFRQIGALLVECVGKFGRVYRFVGGAFVALCPKVDMEQLTRVAEVARRKAAESVFRIESGFGPQSAQLTITCGVAICEGDNGARVASGIETRDQLLRAAATALATGQQAGPNRVVAYRKQLVKAA